MGLAQARPNYPWLSEAEELGNNQNCEEVAGRESDDEDDTADQEELPKLKSYKEAVVSCFGRSVTIFGI